MEKNTEPSNCKKYWIGKDSEIAYCSIHNTYFWSSKNQKCKYYNPNISDGENSTKSEVYKNSTSKSQVNTSKSQGVTSKSNNISQVNDSRDTFLATSSKRKYNRKRDLGVWERFHNYGLKFVAQVHWDALFQYEEKHLRNNVSYKRVDLPNAIVRVFRKSILIVLRSSKEIVGLDVKSAEMKAIALMVETLNALPKAIIVSDKDIASVHNAFVHHPTAKLFRQAFGRDMNVKDDNGVTHLITDNSHGNSELEYINKDTAINMSVYRENYEANIIFKQPPMPSIIAYRVDKNEKDIRDTIDVLNAVKNEALIPLTNQLKLHLGVEDKQDKNMDLMNINLMKQNELLAKQNKILQSQSTPIKESSKESSQPATISRYDVEKKDKIRKFIDEYR